MLMTEILNENNKAIQQKDMSSIVKRGLNASLINYINQRII